MKINILFPMILVLLIIGCKKVVPEVLPPATEEAKVDTTKTACYSYNANGSSISLQLNYKDASSVSGNLTYNLKEKDSNTGTFNGKLENDILIADYTFQSEGTESTRQIAFKMVNVEFIEGYGELTLDGTHFRDVSQLKFTSTMPLSKVDCSK